MIAERGIGLRAEVVKPVFAAAIAISLMMSIATAVGRPPVSTEGTEEHGKPSIRNQLDSRSKKKSPVFLCVRCGKESSATNSPDWRAVNYST
jgi:hypothetical protein